MILTRAKELREHARTAGVTSTLHEFKIAASPETVIALCDALIAADGALRELVALKDLKDAMQSTNPMAQGAPGKVRFRMLADYEHRKPLAWDAARAYIRSQDGFA